MSGSFDSFLSEHGFSDLQIILDGKLHRVDDGSRWYQGSVNGVPGKEYRTLTIGDWRISNESIGYFSEANGHAEGMTTEEAALARKLHEERKKELEKEREASYERSQITIREEMAQGKEIGSHPYLTKKQIDPAKIRGAALSLESPNGQALLISMYNKNSELRGCQKILQDGTKRFCPGQRNEGLHALLRGENTEINSRAIGLTEGFATAYSIREATGLDVYIAFNAGNLSAVARILREKFPDRKIIIFGDDDKNGKINVGRTKAEEAAREVGGVSLFPVFSDKTSLDDKLSACDNLSDWNDLHVREGIQSCQTQINSSGVFDNESKARPRVADDGVAGDEIRDEDSKGEEKAGEVNNKEGVKKKKKKERSLYDIGQQFLIDSGFLDKNGNTTLRYHNQTFYKYKNGVYEEIEDDSMNDILMRWMVNVGMPSKAGGKSMGVVLKTLKTKPRFLGSETQLPVHIDNAGRVTDVKHLIPMSNGLFDCKLFAEKTEWKLIPHSPEYFFTHKLKYGFDISAECPTYDKICSDVFDSEEERLAWEEVMGVHLFSPCLIEKFFVLSGEGANGKSVLITILKVLLGNENVSSVPLDCFNGSSFNFINTLGKLANIIPDMKDISEIDEGTLKAFISREEMHFNRKGKPYVKALPTAYLTVCTNVLPRFTDKSEGIWRRLILFQFNKVVAPEKQNPSYREESFWTSSGELPGIFNRALMGMRRVYERNGKVQETKSMRHAALEYQHNLNYVAQFATECINHTNNQEDSVSTREVYEAYKGFVFSLGGRSPHSQNEFTRLFKNEFLKIDRELFVSKNVVKKEGIVSRFFHRILLNEYGRSVLPGTTNII